MVGSQLNLIKKRFSALIIIARQLYAWSHLRPTKPDPDNPTNQNWESKITDFNKRELVFAQKKNLFCSKSGGKVKSRWRRAFSRMKSRKWWASALVQHFSWIFKIVSEEFLNHMNYDFLIPSSGTLLLCVRVERIGQNSKMEMEMARQVEKKMPRRMEAVRGEPGGARWWRESDLLVERGWLLKKGFPLPYMLHLVPYLTFRPPSSPSKRSLSCKSSSRLLTPSTPSTPSTPPTPPPSTPSKRCLSCKSPSRLQKKFLSKTDSAIELVSVKVDFFQLRWKTQISILWPVCLRNLFHFYFAVCPSFSSRASARFLPAPPFQQQRTTKSSVDRAKKECRSGPDLIINGWKHPFFQLIICCNKISKQAQLQIIFWKEIYE